MEEFRSRDGHSGEGEQIISALELRLPPDGEFELHAMVAFMSQFTELERRQILSDIGVTKGRIDTFARGVHLSASITRIKACEDPERLNQALMSVITTRSTESPSVAILEAADLDVDGSESDVADIEQAS